MSMPRPINVAIAALGGEGGGVVSDWMIRVAAHEGYLAQATSVPGVAQRTGATIYYLEFFPRSALPADGARPVLALMPHPGDVDVVVASEIMEAGRALQRGIVTRDRTTLIASSHRVYAIGEKSHMADGRADARRVAELARMHAKRFVQLDMQAIAAASGSVISAAMLGALAGSGALPFALDSYREAIRQGSIAVTQSMAAFDAAAAAASNAESPAPRSDAAVVYRQSELPASLHDVLARVPEAARAMAGEGIRRLIDYQDVSYARLYMERLEPMLRFERDPAGAASLTGAVAAGLALWMSFEDTIRVADLKIRASRARRVHEEVRAGAQELVSVKEFMKPRVEEICGSLPASLGRWILASPTATRMLARFTGDRQIATSSIGGFMLLYMVAGLRRWRRATLRFAEEDGRIQAWLELIGQTAVRDYALAVEIAECQGLVKGYGSTRERGTRSFDLIVARARELLGHAGAARSVRELRGAANADEEGVALARALAG
jgi:indolepyruvate ferredoxin oxidoreductase beta subunit